jgi:hypothetical protein
MTPQKIDLDSPVEIPLREAIRDVVRDEISPVVDRVGVMEKRMDRFKWWTGGAVAALGTATAVWLKGMFGIES